MTPAGPRLSVDTDVALLSDQANDWRSYYARDTRLRFVDWTGDQHLASGWVNARVPTYFQFRKNEDRRERLTVQKKADGSLVVVNALGADIRRLYLADSSGKLFEGRDIAAGQEGRLAPAGDLSHAPKDGPTFARHAFTTDWLSTFQGFATSKSPGLMLSPGCYWAFLSDSPFVEKPLEGVVSEDTLAIVYGITKEADDGPK